MVQIQALWQLGWGRSSLVETLVLLLLVLSWSLLDDELGFLGRRGQNHKIVKTCCDFPTEGNYANLSQTNTSEADGRGGRRLDLGPFIKDVQRPQNFRDFFNPK